jgi:hypothetical protein
MSMSARRPEKPGGLSARCALRALFVNTLRALKALACQHFGFCRSDPRPGAYSEPLPAAVGFYALGEATKRLAEMPTSRRARRGGVPTSGSRRRERAD